jgi:RNA polymerase sigma factor (TIGR02999 family)
MSEVTRVLDQVQQGDPHAGEQLLLLVYDELRKLAAQKLAQEKPGQTLQATALVHEAYLRLVGSAEAPHWDNRRHFFAAAAEAMRRILIDNARRKQTHKHGGGVSREDVDFDALPGLDVHDPLEVMAVHELLDQLARKAPREAELVKLRYFLGCTVAEAAQVLGIAPATAQEDWSYARAWLKRQWLRGQEDKPASALTGSASSQPGDS